MFNLLGKTNDPRETKTWEFPIEIDGITMLYAPDNDDRDPKRTEINKIASEVRIKEWKVFCVTKHSRSKKVILEDYQIEENYFKFGFCHPRLWADYGDQHSGICIIFDGKKLNQKIHKTFSNDCKIFQGSVKYDDLSAVSTWTIKVPEIEKPDVTSLVRDFFYQHYKTCFLTKTKDWMSENEYRWLVHSPIQKPEFVPIEGAIKSVIVGSDFPTESRKTLKSLCKELNIPAGHIDWMNGKPKVYRESIYAL